MTSTILDLPDELLVQISSYLILPSLGDFALTCQSFARTSHRRLQHHLSLRKRYRHLSDVNPDHPNVWLTSLAAILRQQVPACYVEKVSITRAEWYWANVPESYQADPLYETADLELAYQAARDSPWIYEHDACGLSGAATSLAEFITEIGEGDQDNILAVLLPLLPNLASLELPVHSMTGYDSALRLGSVPGVVERIAVASASDQYTGPGAIKPSRSASDIPWPSPRMCPLQNLKTIIVRQHNHRGANLDEIRPFLSLPSVDQVIVHCAYAYEFWWSGSLPKSRARSIVFIDPDIPVMSVVRLAKGLVGPCVIENRREHPIPGARDVMRWRTVMVDVDGHIKLDGRVLVGGEHLGTTAWGTPDIVSL